MCQSKSVGGVCVPTSWKQQKCSPPLLVFQKGFTRLGLWSAVAHHFLRLFQFSKLEQFFKIKRKKQQKKSLKSPAARQHSSMTAITWRIGSNKSIMVNESKAKYPQFNCFSNCLCDSFQLFFFWSREEPSQFDPLWPDLVQENDALHLKTELILLICAEDRFHTLLRS